MDEDIFEEGPSKPIMPQQQVSKLLNQRLQHAADFGQHLATALANFEQELNDWRTSIASLQGAGNFFSAAGAPQTPVQVEAGKQRKSVAFHMEDAARSGNGDEARVSKKVEFDFEDVAKGSIRDEHLTLRGKINQLKITGQRAPSNTLQNSTADSESPQVRQSILKAVTATDSLTKSQTSISIGMQSTADFYMENMHPQIWELWTKHGEAKKKLASANRFAAHESEKQGFREMNKLHLQFLDRFVINPSSATRYQLDIFSLLVVVLDIVTFPLVVFDFDETKVAKYWRIGAAIYWTIDMVLSFFSGYQKKNGDTEMRFWMTSRRCLRTKAPFDISIVLLDWSLYILDSAKGLATLARVTKSARLMRLLRLLRAIRSVKLFALIEKVKTWPVSNSLFTLLNVARLILKVMIINHFLGCGWYAIGTINADEENNWVHKYLKPEDHMFRHYLTSYHWSIAQFTPCPVNVHPVNTRERMYAVLMLPFGLVIFAVLLGNVTAIVNAARKSNYEQMKASYNLREFLQINNVPSGLSNRIQTFLRAHRIKKGRILESDVPPLQSLASSLRQELHFKVHGPILDWHPFLHVLGKTYHDTFVHFCHSATKLTTLPFGDEIFHYRSKSESMYMILSGHLEYISGRNLHKPEKVSLDAEGWLCEAPLWLHWENRGYLAVGEQTDIVIIDANRFRKAATFHASSLPFLKRYALLYARTLSQDAKEQRIVIDDLWGTKYGVRELLMFQSAANMEAALNQVAREEMSLDDFIDKPNDEFI